MKKVLLMACLTGAAWCQELGVIKVFSGDEGMQVTVSRYGPLEKNQALLKFSNLDSPWNEKVFLARIEETERQCDYVIQVDGSDWYAIVGRNNYYGGWSYEAFPKGPRREYRIVYDSAASKAATADDLLKGYQP
jgi:hypothetical protein